MNHTVSASEVYDLASGILGPSLGWVDHGYRCTVRTVFLVLFLAASRAGSIFDACRRLRQAPTDQAIRNALVAQLPEQMPDVEERLNQALVAKLPKGMFRRSRAMAIDTSEIGYYGQPHQQQRELRRGKRTSGTTRFHCYATLCVVHRGERFTVGLTYVWADDTRAGIVKRLLERARQIGLRCRYVLLDRGFYGLDVVQYLQSRRCPFLMPVVHRGRRSKRPLSELKGTRRFLALRRSGFGEHVMTNRKQQARVKICVMCPRPTARTRKPRPRVFAFWGMGRTAPAAMAQRYRRRFGIETSYRQMNQGRIRTCCRDPRIRLLLVGIALVLRNVWVWLHRMVLGVRRGQGIQLCLERLRLRTVLLMLQRCAEAALGIVETAYVPIEPRLAARTGTWNYWIWSFRNALDDAAR